MIMALLIIGALLVGIGLGQPLYVILAALTGILLLVGTNVYTEFESLDILIEMTRQLSDQEVLLAIPFFVISGAIMSEGDISRRLVNFATVGFRGVPGALAVSAVIGCVFFAALSGSTAVTVIAIGSIVYPSMVANRYSQNFSTGLLASAGSLGILIPPSIPMIVYSIVDPHGLMDPPTYSIAKEGQQTGLVDLFLAGVGPGLFIGFIFVIASILYGSKLDKPEGEKVSVGTQLVTLFAGIAKFLLRLPVMGLIIGSGFWIVALIWTRRSSNVPAWLERGKWLRDFVETFWESFWALMLPAIILGGIYSGVFTPTEAACVSVVYALVVELFIYRSFRAPRIPAILSESTVLIGSLLIILAVAQGFNRYLEDADIPNRLVAFILDMQLSTVAFLLVLNIMLLIVGCFMDLMSAVLIFVPLISPVAYQLGIHPIHLAIIFMVNLEIGYLTPPMGLNLFVSSTIFKRSMGDVIRSVLPFIAMMMIGLGAVTYIPTIALGPVSWANGNGFIVPFPERKLPMKSLTTSEAVQLLARFAPTDDDDADAGPTAQEQAEAAAGGRALTMAELTMLAMAAEDEDAVNALQYDTLDELLVDYGRVFRRETTLRNLEASRTGGDDDDYGYGDDDYDYGDENNDDDSGDAPSYDEGDQDPNGVEAQPTE